MAGGVADALAEGLVLAEHLLIAAVWVNPEAADEEAVFANNREATTAALAAGRRNAPSVDEVLAARAAPANPFFRTV